MPERNCVFIPVDRLGLGIDVPAPKMKADTSFTFVRSRGPCTSFRQITKPPICLLVALYDDR